MQVFYREYFEKFRCAAGACPDTCCKEWDVLVDPETARKYRALDGELGDRLRQMLREEDGETVIGMVDGHCPMWQADGLCQVQRELGEAALCQVCREFPRLTHDYGDFLERGLEMSCPEAARWILEDDSDVYVSRIIPGEECGTYDRDEMAVLRESRGTVLELLRAEERTVGEALAVALLYGCQIQGQLDGGEAGDFDPEAALAEARELARPGNVRELLDFFLGLEILTPQWEARLRVPEPGDWEKRHRAMAKYLVDRYWLQAVSDGDLYSRVKFIVTACLVVKLLGGDTLETAQLFSKEIENDADNLDAILDGAYREPALRDGRLLGLLLGMEAEG